MGSRGPKKTPAALLKLHGTYREDRHGGPSVSADAPSCPSWLSREAKAEWRRVVKTLVETVGLAKIDRSLLAVYCETWAEYRQAVETTRKEGDVYESHTQSGMIMRRHPAVEIRNAARRDLAKIGAQLGLSPSGRTGLKIDLSSGVQTSGVTTRKRG